MSCTVCGRPIRQNRGLVQSLTRLPLALLGSLSAFLRCRCHTPFMSISDRRLESDHGPGSIFSSWACSCGFIAGFPEFAGTTQCFGSPAIAGFIVAAVAAESPAGEAAIALCTDRSPRLPVSRRRAGTAARRTRQPARRSRAREKYFSTIPTISTSASAPMERTSPGWRRSTASTISGWRRLPTSAQRGPHHRPQYRDLLSLDPHHRHLIVFRDNDGD